MAATVERFGAKILQSAVLPTLLTNERAVLPCGCCIFVGLRMDNHEQATATATCSDGHVELMGRAHELWVASLDDPQDRPTVDVAAEVLTQAAGEVVTDA